MMLGQHPHLGQHPAQREAAYCPRQTRKNDWPGRTKRRNRQKALRKEWKNALRHSVSDSDVMTNYSLLIVEYCS